MKIYGELESAQLEGFTTVNLPLASANYRRAVYDITLNKMVISDGTSWLSASAAAPIAQYSIGVNGDYPTFAIALAAHPSNTAFVLDKSYVAVENVTIAGNNISVIGQGAISLITGNLTVNAGVSFFLMEKVKITGDVTITATASSTCLTNIWLSNTSVATDNGDNSYILALQA